MAEGINLTRPWLIAVWPGMGHVAVSAGYYLMSKLGVYLLAELSARELFDIDHVEVKEGIVQPGRLPRSRFFVWKDPEERHDLVIFLGEAQPPLGRYPFCKKLMEYARQLGVERVVTFAAMATQMHPEHDSRVFAAATDREALNELKDHAVEILEDGQISGLNGVLVGVAAESGMRGTCLLGEMPHLFSQLPFPKASLAVLKVFTSLARINIDFSELAEQADVMGKRLGELLSQAQEAIEERLGDEDDDDDEEFNLSADDEEEGLTSDEAERIESLFDLAKQDRSKAYELKRELDRLEVFDEYEDRFLDLFRK